MTVGTRELLTHDFPLRRNLIVRFTVPIDLTTDEADRLVGFVSSLVFPARALPAPTPETAHCCPLCHVFHDLDRACPAVPR
jgi:hypothetical protein